MSATNPQTTFACEKSKKACEECRKVWRIDGKRRIFTSIVKYENHIHLILSRIHKTIFSFLQFFLHYQRYWLLLSALFPHFLKTNFGNRRTQFFSILEWTIVPLLELYWYVDQFGNFNAKWPEVLQHTWFNIQRNHEYKRTSTAANIVVTKNTVKSSVNMGRDSTSSTQKKHLNTLWSGIHNVIVRKQQHRIQQPSHWVS